MLYEFRIAKTIERTKNKLIMYFPGDMKFQSFYYIRDTLINTLYKKYQITINSNSRICTIEFYNVV